MTVSTLFPESPPVCDMNTTPLIDVMLVLLIMFIITLPVMTHAVKLDMPSAVPPQNVSPPEVVDLDVEFDGTVVWNGTVVPSLQTLESYLRVEAAKQPQPEIHFRPDGRAKYGAVAVVLAAAQRNHLKKIGFVNTPQFRD
jgi:biopolymer transport protein ExbD